MSSLLLTALLAWPAWAGPKLTGSTESIPRNADTGGGDRLTGAGLILNNAVAETAVSSFTGAGIRLYTGLMHLVAQPGSIVSITTVTKATDTLQLSWAAPGLDGFLGSVNGFYRIDYSSLTSHLFDPTTYQVEIATTVAPGDPQVYTLTGLEPNTTYYTRIYLADARKVVAETSDQSDESTLTHPPAAPVLSGVFCSSVAFTWTLPFNGAEGYRIDSSSTDFGALFPGGAVTSSMTRNGLTVTLAVEGLSDDTTYYFKLGSLNWQDDLNFSTILSTKTPSGCILPIQNLALFPDRLNRRVLLTWTNPVFPSPAGVLVQVSSNPIAQNPVNGTPYGLGFSFPDGSVVGSSAAATSHLELGLELDTTRYFRLYSKNTSQIYSIAVSTEVVLDFPPLAPAELRGDLTPATTAIVLRWGGVTSNMDGSSFKVPAAPIGWELQRYEVYRATGIVRSNWVFLGSAPLTAGSFEAGVPTPSDVYYYKIVSKDGFGPEADSSMVLDTLGNVFAVGGDQVSRLMIPTALAGTLHPAGNSYGRPLLVRASDKPQDLGGRIVKSVDFAPLQVPDAAAAPAYKLNDPSLQVTLRYEVAGGQVVPSAAGLQGLGPAEPAVPAVDAPQNLGTYWFNGREYIKLYGRVDPLDQTVQVMSGMPGQYQIRTLLRDQALNFDVSNISNKAVTPNGDGLNDAVVFVFDNPRDVGVSGKVFDRRGAFVADMAAGPVANSLQWDGRAGGRAVAGGVYLYQIRGEDKTFNGTVLVIR